MNTQRLHPDSHFHVVSPLEREKLDSLSRLYQVVGYVVKVYPTKWGSDSIRGSTIYKPWSNGEVFALLDSTEMLLHTWNLHAGSNTVLIETARKSIDEILHAFNQSSIT